MLPWLDCTSVTIPGTALAMFFCKDSAICCNCCFCSASVFHLSIRSLPIFTLVELVTCCISCRMALRLVAAGAVCCGCGADCIRCAGEDCVCACAAAPYPANNKRAVTANAVFMVKHSCTHLR